MTAPNKVEFDQFADDYTSLVRGATKLSGESPDYFARYKAQYMASHDATTKPGRHILDFGCGIGNSIPHLRAAFPAARLHGVDPSADSIRIARARCGDAAEFRVGDDKALPYADASFDLIQAACVFHHIPPGQRDRWLIELYRVLRPGGKLFIFEHNLLNPLTVHSVKHSPIDVDAILLPRRELSTRLHHANFSHVSTRYIVFFPAFLRHLRPLEPWLGWIPFGAQYVTTGIRTTNIAVQRQSGTVDVHGDKRT